MSLTILEQRGLAGRCARNTETSAVNPAGAMLLGRIVNPPGAWQRILFFFRVWLHGTPEARSSLPSRAFSLTTLQTCCGGDATANFSVTIMKNPDSRQASDQAPSNRAAVYVRMSTEHQQYSTNNQLDVIQEYALRRNLEIVIKYSDEGKSGLNIQGRDSLARMISDVENKRAHFNCILVYDISRWGRFQDADESAYYEYLCKRAGIAVHYCAEQFENDGSNSSTIIKSVKKGHGGRIQSGTLGQSLPGRLPPDPAWLQTRRHFGFGLRRMLVDHTASKREC